MEGWESVIMKQTGIVRQLDKLGRIVLPMELRRVFEINHEDYLEIYVEDGRIILEKYQPDCIFCHGKEDVVEVKGKYICKKCLAEMPK